MQKTVEGAEDIDTIVAALEETHRQLGRAGRATLARVAPKISPGEFQVVHRLTTDGACRTGDLAAALAIPPSTLTRYSDHLVQLGLITRRRDEHNRREVRLSVTTNGRKVVRRVLEARSEAVGTMFARLDASERAELLDLLAVLAGQSGAARHPASTASRSA